MTVWLDIDGAVGKAAVYTGTDDAPLYDPLNNLSRVLFHSDLLYPKIVAVRSGTLSLPARAAGAELLTTHTLFSHGAGGVPMVFGHVTVSGVRMPLVGSVPVQMHQAGWARWLNLGADATTVKIAENTFANRLVGFAALSLAWTVYQTDTLL